MADANRVEIRVLSDYLIPLTEYEKQLVETFGLDNVYDLPAVEPGTVVSAFIDSAGRAHYNHPDTDAFAPWYSDKDAYELVSETSQV